jgi:uncharacterized membrane protein
VVDLEVEGVQEGYFTIIVLFRINPPIKYSELQEELYLLISLIPILLLDSSTNNMRLMTTMCH